MRRTISLVCGTLATALVLALSADTPPPASNTWSPGGSLTQARAGAAATLLDNGDVLVTGGSTGTAATASAERYNPAAGAFAPAASMQTARTRHTSVLLPDGRVIVAGGIGADGLATSAVEIYDPGANVWMRAAPLHAARADATATALYDGRIVVAGGRDGASALDTIEIFDPETGVFGLSSARLGSARSGHATALLNDGTVIITGGFDVQGALASVDIYDPFADTIAAGPPLTTARSGHSATTLLSGKVLIAAGQGSGGDLTSAEVFDPSTGSFALTGTPMVSGRRQHQAFLLPHNNQVLIVGGVAGSGAAVTTAEVFVEWQGEGGAFYPAAPPAAARASAAGAALSVREERTRRTGPNDGRLLLAGGSAGADDSHSKAGSEIYNFATVVTDRADYAPGSRVTITGSGWMPGELVSLTFVEEPARDIHTLRAVRADGSGHIISAEFVPDAGDEGIRFFVTASGQQSQARTSFADSVTWLNETDLPAEADYANLQFPSSLSNSGGTTSMIFGQIYEAGVTEAAGASPSILAQVGYGPVGSDPRVNPGWVWTSTVYNTQVGNNDEYRGTLTLPPGAYSYTFRFSFDGGSSFTLGDLDGAGSNAGLTFSSTQLGLAMAVAPTLSGINPGSGEQGQAVGVTLTGTQFAPDQTTVAVTGPGINVSNVAVADATHVTATFTIAGGALATTRAVTVTTPGGTSGSLPFTVTGTANPPVTWMNETDQPGEADFAILQFPANFTNSGAPSPAIFARVFESGVTPAAGPSSLVVAQIGYGPYGTDPRVTPWVWAPATFNTQVGNDDEYQASLTLPLGTYSYTFRFSIDGGFTFTLADLDGAGSGTGLAFSTAQLGVAMTAPALTSIDQPSAGQGQTIGVTLTGNYFVPGATAVGVSGPGINASNVAVVDATHVTATFTIAGGAPATARTVTVTTPGGTSSPGVTFTVTASSNPPVTWLNETDQPGEADFAGLQFPATFTNTGAPTAIFGRVFEVGVTEAAGPAPGVIAQVGYGPAGSDPRVTPWVWAPATFNMQVGNDDEYQATLTLPPGSYSYTFRFSLDGGFSFTLADLDGAGSGPGLTFSVAQLGQATTVPTLSNITPASAQQGQTVGVTLTGADFVNGSTSVNVSGFGVSVSNVNVVDAMHVTATFTIAGGAPATARTVTVTTPGGTSSPGVTFTVTSSGNPPVTWLNETDLASEADFAVLQFPATFTNTGAPTMIFGRLFETGVTEAAGPAPLVVAQVGYGPVGSDPRVTPWVWAPATFNTQVGNDDEYQASLTLPPGSYSYTFRFSLDGGFSFTLADLDGAGANAGLVFSTSQLGTATGLPAVPAVRLNVNGQHPPNGIVTTAGPMALTLSISPSSYTGTLRWYWIVAVNNQGFFITPTGVSTTPAPLVVAPPVVITDAPLLNVNVPAGTTITNVFLLVDGAGAVVGADVISAVRP